MIQLLRSLMFVLPLLGSAGTLADEGSTKVWPANVGSRSLSLPIPDGYVEATEIAPILRQMGERMAPPSNRVLAYFVSPAEVQAVRAAPEKQLDHYFLVQTLRQIESTGLTQRDFDEARTSMREQYKVMLAESATAVQPQIDSVLKDLDASRAKLESLQVGQMRGVEVFMDRSNDISLLALTKVSAQIEGKTIETALAIGINVALVRNQLVYFYVYAKYGGEDDLDWIRKQSKDWLERTFAVNQ